MAQLPNSFNKDKHQKMDDFTALPPDNYLCQIIKSEIKPTKDGNGKRLVFSFKVLNGKFKGRVIFVGLNIVNKNDQAVDIANRELATIQDAANINGDMADTDVLHGIPMLLKTSVREANANFPEQTRVVMYSKFDGTMPEKDEAKSKPDAGEDKPEKKRRWD